MPEKGIYGQLVDAVDFFCPRLLGLPLLRGRFRLRREPNDFLRKQVAGLKPGRAICLAEGEGRNAVHLARLGHKVIAQDLMRLA
jgi:hypothetical protein